MNASRHRLFRLTLLAVISTVAPSLLHAQGDAAAAQALFDEGKRLLGEGHYGQACPKFQESQRLDPGMGTLLNLAVCYERAGKTASAWGHFKEVLTGALRDGRRDRAAFAQQHIRALTPKLSWLTVAVGPDARVQGLVVRRAEVMLGAASWGQAMPIDPGVYPVTAEAPGHQRWESSITIGPDGDRQTLTVPVLAVAPTAAPPPAPASASLPTGPPPPAGTRPSAAPAPDAPQEPDTAGGGQRLAGLFLVGVGTAATVVGAVFGGLAISEESDADALCGDGSSECTTEEGMAASDAARLDAKLANGFVFGGLGLAAVGLVVALTAPDAAPSDRAAVVTPCLGADRLGLKLRWRW